jgi:hypothetical protein
MLLNPMCLLNYVDSYEQNVSYFDPYTASELTATVTRLATVYCKVIFLENIGAELFLFYIAYALEGKCDIKPRITGINTPTG